MKNAISTLICLLAFAGLSAGNPPTVVCLNGLSANLMPTGEITIWSVDLMAYAEDQETPFTELVFGLRIAGAGSGFPNSNSFSFNCDHLGDNEVELWVMDADGNTAQCNTVVNIQDFFGFCDNAQDQTPPVVTSLAELPVEMSQTGEVVVLASDLFVWAQDDVTSADELDIAIRIAGDGSGFPLDEFGQPQSSVTLGCDHLGGVNLEVWVRDAAGNASYTVSNVALDDPEGICDQQASSAHDPSAKVRALVCFPNPAGPASRLALPALSADSNWQISISDQLGRMLVRDYGTGNSFDLGGKNLKSGLYWVQIAENNGRTYAGKLIIFE